MNFYEASFDIKALHQHFEENREKVCNESLQEALEKCNEWEMPTERRKRQKKRMPGETAMDVDLSAKDEMMKVMKNAVDGLMAEINEKPERLHDLDCRFGFLLDVNVLIGSDEEEKVAQLRKNCIRVG